MLKRLSLVGAFCIGLIALWCGHANAWPASSSGWYVKTGSIIVDSSWVHISNTDVKPTDLVASIDPKFLVYYRNPASNEGGVGVPFNTNVLVGTDSLNPLVGRGKADSEIVFPSITFDWLVENYTIEYLNSFSPNPKWTAYDAVLTGFDVKIQAYADVSDYCNSSNTLDSDWTSCYYNSDFNLYEEEVVHIEGLCGSTPIEGRFPCVESEHWEWSKKDPLWP